MGCEGVIIWTMANLIKFSGFKTYIQIKCEAPNPIIIQNMRRELDMSSRIERSVKCPQCGQTIVKKDGLETLILSRFVRLSPDSASVKCKRCGTNLKLPELVPYLRAA